MSISEERTLFIFGASPGIGFAIALRAEREGANVVIAAKTETENPRLPRTIHTAAAAIEAAGEMWAKWFVPHVAYTIAKYRMSMCILGMAEELPPWASP